MTDLAKLKAAMIKYKESRAQMSRRMVKEIFKDSSKNDVPSTPDRDQPTADPADIALIDSSICSSDMSPTVSLPNDSVNHDPAPGSATSVTVTYGQVGYMKAIFGLAVAVLFVGILIPFITSGIANTEV